MRNLLFTVLAAMLPAPRRRSLANTYDEAVATHESTVTRTVAAAIPANSRHLLYKAASATSVGLCGANDTALGTVDNESAAAGDIVTVLLLGKGATKKVVASGVVAVGAEVAQDASGKVRAVAGAGTYRVIGTALTASDSDGDLIEIVDSRPVVRVVA